MQVNDGDDVALAGTSAVERPELAGTVMEDELLPFADRGTTGVLQSRVVQTGAGGLDFYFRIRDFRGAPVFRVGWNLFGPIETDIDFRTDGLGEIGPSRVSRRDWPQPGGLSTVSLDFWFGGTLADGSSSRYVFVRTDHRDYSRYDGLFVQGEPRTDGSSAWEVLINAFGSPGAG